MNILEQLAKINTFVFDVDGVLTDGMVLVLPNGVQARTMNTKDGYALQLAVKKGYKVVIISGGFSPDVKDRLNKLGVADVFMQVHNKIDVLANYMQQHQLQAETMLYMGDDIPDVVVMQACGIATCPADAVAEVKAIAHYISPLTGGRGCARDVIEKVMKLRGDWNDDSHTRSV